jgi:LytS/YehU family sensor histidine kinase
MRTPFSVSLVAACGVFVAALLAALLHHNTINGHTLTPLEQLPEALVLAVMFSAFALLGTWLGMRRGTIQHLTYRTGLIVALLYVAASFLANALIYTAPQTVTFPSHEANVQGVEVMLIGMLWGIGTPYTIALLVRRFKFFGTFNGA